MAGIPLRWWTYHSLLHICLTLAICGDNCESPTIWYFSVYGYGDLTLRSRIDQNMYFVYTRHGNPNNPNNPTPSPSPSPLPPTPSPPPYYGPSEEYCEECDYRIDDCVCDDDDDDYGRLIPIEPYGPYDPFDPNDPLHLPFASTRSAFRIPDAQLAEGERERWIREYYDNGGASNFELQMIRLVNEAREHYGLHPVQIDASLVHAARFYAQTLANLNLPLSSSVGPYGGSRATAVAFGARTRWSGGSGNGGGWSYQAIFNRWMTSTGHRNFLLSESNRYIGFGSHLGGSHGVFHYLIMSDRSSG